MKQLPPGIPPANSSKWHARRWWDGLGYIRARSLTNPSWQRDVRWLIQVVVRQQPQMPAEEQAHYKAILAVLRRYPRTANGTLDADAAWDEVLAAIDELSATPLTGSSARSPRRHAIIGRSAPNAA